MRIAEFHHTHDAVRERLSRLDTARWLAAAAVVLLHSAAQTLADGAASYGSDAWIAANVYDSAARWCVPVFVMISGALLLDPGKPQGGLKRFYQKRMARVLTPLVFWTLFFLGWRVWQEWLDTRVMDPTTPLRTVVMGTPYYHLWYLYMIVGLYLFAPFVRTLYARISDKQRRFAVAAMLGLAVGEAIYRQIMDAPNGFFMTWFVPYIGYFIAGRMIFEGRLRIPMPGLIVAVSVIATAAGVYLWSDADQFYGYFYDNFSITVAPMSVAMFQWLVSGPRLPRLAGLGPLTFGIYLVHPVFLDLARRGGAFSGDAVDIVAVPLIAAITFALSAMASWLLLRHPITRKLI